MAKKTSSRKSRPAVVFVVAHPDDIAIGMGGTACLLKKKYDLHVICASRGERGYAWKGKGFADRTAPPNYKLAAIRTKEEQAECKLLGASLTFLDVMDGEIFADRAVVERVAKQLKQLRPKALFTLSPYDKFDHAAMYMISLQALHLAGIFWETEMYHASGGREADLFVNISKVVDQKRKLMACHRTQMKNAAGIEHMLGMNRALGRLAWCEYAEAYTASLPLMAERWNRKAGSILMEYSA